MSTEKPIILTIGKATQDVFLKSDEFDPHVEGKVAYTHLPLGAKLDLDEVIFATGGNATNVAATLARQGLHSRYMWLLGTDPASQAIIQELDLEGIDTSLVTQDDSYKASYSSILIASNGERTILNYHGTTIKGKENSLNLEAIAGSDWVYPSSIGDMSLLNEIISYAKAHNVKVMLNPATSELKEINKLKALLEDVDVLAVNKEEASLLFEGKNSEELARHASHYCPVIIVSDGSNGVVATDGKTIISAGMYEDVPVLDRTGAGDAFASGFLSQWSFGKSLEEAIIFASANSTSVVGQIGAKAGILHAGAQLHDMPIESKPF